MPSGLFQFCFLGVFFLRVVCCNYLTSLSPCPFSRWGASGARSLIRFFIPGHSRGLMGCGGGCRGQRALGTASWCHRRHRALPGHLPVPREGQHCRSHSLGTHATSHCSSGPVSLLIPVPRTAECAWTVPFGVMVADGPCPRRDGAACCRAL